MPKRKALEVLRAWIEKIVLAPRPDDAQRAIDLRGVLAGLELCHRLARTIMSPV